MGKISNYLYYKMIVAAANGLFLLLGAALICVGVYIAVDHGDLSEISGSIIYLAGFYILIFVGTIVMLIALVGFAAAKSNNRCLILTYVTVIILLLILSFVACILVLAFKSSMTDGARQSMRASLTNNYGRSSLITHAWDLAQTKLRCCAVDDRGWTLYIDSYWDRWINADTNDRTQKILVTSPFYKLVPESCCWRLVDPRTAYPTNVLRNVGRCQHWQYGPPLFTTGPHNDAIYYRGCFGVIRDYMDYHANYIGGIGITLIIVMIVSVIASCKLLGISPEKRRY